MRHCLSSHETALTHKQIQELSNIATLLRLTGDVFEQAEHFALRRDSLDVRMVLQHQQVTGRSLADVDQLEVTGEVGCWIFPGNDAPLQQVIADVPQGTADVQAARFGREVADKSDDVFCRNRPGTLLKTRRYIKVLNI